VPDSQHNPHRNDIFSVHKDAAAHRKGSSLSSCLRIEGVLKSCHVPALSDIGRRPHLQDASSDGGREERRHHPCRRHVVELHGEALEAPAARDSSPHGCFKLAATNGRAREALLHECGGRDCSEGTPLDVISA